jgi:hypothetical protein
MADLNTLQVVAVVQEGITKVLGRQIKFPDPQVEEFKCSGHTYDTLVYQLSSFPGLKVPFEASARSIKMRGRIELPTEGPPWAPFNDSQTACILICDGDGAVKLSLRKRTREGLLNDFKDLIAKEDPPTSVSASRTWAQLLERVCDEAADGGADDGMVSVSRKDLVALARAMLELVRPRGRVGGEGV